MHQITSYFFMYAKVVVTDKVPFFWTLGIPLVIALTTPLSGVQQATPAEYYGQLSYYWVYIILATYVNGVGIELARMREYGLMKTYVMISGNKLTYVIAVILAQLLFASISLLLFTTVVTLVHGFFSFTLLVSALLVLIGSIPFAVASVAVTALPVKVSSLGTFANILMFPLFLLAIKSPDQWFSFLNPFYSLHKFALGLLHLTTQVDLSFGVWATFLSVLAYFIIGAIALKRFSLVSLMTR
ncbi:hypothetical protein [Exiguobacterium qingdaonense]|uniref:hypothetical protein n=1 Tax=Exiguobacterium qingdaonense TaxID=2751251 RepID=UPI001BE59DCD|nr:hypothetical protein [Exiguobacterium qingdaonense]